MYQICVYTYASYIWERMINGIRFKDENKHDDELCVCVIMDTATWESIIEKVTSE